MVQLAAAQGKGWSEYKFQNPVTGNLRCGTVRDGSRRSAQRGGRTRKGTQRCQGTAGPREALAQVRREGGRLGGEALGWRRTAETDAHGRRRTEPLDEERAILARIRALRAEGLSVRAIAARLSADGVRTKKGARWHPTQVQRVLSRDT